VFRRPRQGCLAKSTIRHGAEGTGKIQESFLKEMTSSITLTRTNKYLLARQRWKGAKENLLQQRKHKVTEV
jgi:hypothetical protein